MTFAKRVDYAQICATIARGESSESWSTTPMRRTRKSWPLHEAAEAGDVPKCEALLDAGADLHELDATGHTAMDCAIGWSRLEICRLFEERRPGISMHRLEGRQTSLEYAVRLGSSEIVELLVLEYGADANCRLPDGRTLVDLALFDDNEDMAQLLRSLQSEVAIRAATQKMTDESTQDVRPSRPQPAL